MQVRTMYKAIAAGILTGVLIPFVKRYALAHRQQFNFGVVVLLFSLVLAAFAMFSMFRQLWAICADSEEDGNA